MSQQDKKLKACILEKSCYILTPASAGFYKIIALIMSTETRRLGQPGVQEFINDKVDEALNLDPSIGELSGDEKIDAIAQSTSFEFVEMLPLEVRKAIANALGEKYDTDSRRGSDDVVKYGNYSDSASV